MLIRHRRRSSNCVGLPCVRHPRDPAALRRRPLVLGLNFDQVTGLRLLYFKARLQDHQHRWLPRCGPHVGSRGRSLHRPPKILSTVSGQDAIFLHLYLSTQNHPLVLRCYRHSELFSIRSVWPQLALSVLLATRPCLRHFSTRPPLLRYRMGGLPLSIRPTLYKPQLDPAHIRNRSWRSPMGADALGNIEHRTVCSMGWWSGGECHRGKELVALVGRARCASGCRVWNDSAADVNTVPRPIYAARSSSVGFYRHDISSSHGAQQGWAWGCIP